MISGMTGFGGGEVKIPLLGTVRVEMRSSNHKFLEAVLHLPEGFLFFEDKIKKIIESRIKRGRVTCVVSFLGRTNQQVAVNRELLKRYVGAIKKIKDDCGIKEDVKIDTLVNLPGVLFLSDGEIAFDRVWPGFKKAAESSLEKLFRMRLKEGLAVVKHLSGVSESLDANIRSIRARFKVVMQEKISQFKSDIDKAGFLKEADISEELERLSFHVRSFKNKIKANGPVGKELDFICQEMQREANTMGAKSCDVRISARVVSAKSQIEKLREQVQNLE